MPRTSRPKVKVAEADKENAQEDAAHMAVAAPPAAPAAKGSTKSKAAAANAVNLADELEEMTKRMNMISLEKEKAEQLLKERDAQLEQKQAEEMRLQSLLDAKEQEQKKLAEKVRQLQKIKPFQPTIDIPATEASKGKESKKHEKHVKRPMSAFLQWAKEHREEIRKEHPEASFAEISKTLGEKWKAVSDEEKKPYEERYQIEKEVYLKIIGKEKRDSEALKVFQEEQNKKAAVDLLEQYLKYKSEKSLEVDGKKKKKEKDPSKPKKPSSAFFLFSNERRPSLLAEKMKITEIAKRLGEEWKSMDERSRQPYEKTAAVDKERYRRELEAYKLKKAGDLEETEELQRQQTMIQKAQGMQLLKQREHIDLAKKKMHEEKQKKKREKAEAVDPNKPKKPLTSYILYVMDNRKRVQEEKPTASFGEVTAILAVKWQELPEQEKQAWAEKGAIAREQYKVAMDEYNIKKAAGGQEVEVA